MAHWKPHKKDKTFIIGSVVVKALRYKPERVGLGSDEMNDIYQVT